MQLDETTMKRRLGVHNGQRPEHTLTGQYLYGNVSGQIHGIDDTPYFAVTLHGERFDNDAWQQLVAYANQLHQQSKNVKPAKATKTDAVIEDKP